MARKEILPIYKQIYEALKKQIRHGKYNVGESLPSENELCTDYGITRTTARKALDELQRNGFITRQHGRRSVVCERRESIGLLTVKGLSEESGESVKTAFISKPRIVKWNENISFQPSKKEQKSDCIRFLRLRSIGKKTVMVEEIWLAAKLVPKFMDKEFVQGSFFKTLSQRYLTEITGSEQELKAVRADEKIAKHLHLRPNTPILYIEVRYSTSFPDYFVYSRLYCNTTDFSIGNAYLPK